MGYLGEGSLDSMCCIEHQASSVDRVLVDSPVARFVLAPFVLKSEVVNR